MLTPESIQDQLKNVEPGSSAEYALLYTVRADGARERGMDHKAREYGILAEEYRQTAIAAGQIVMPQVTEVSSALALQDTVNSKITGTTRIL